MPQRPISASIASITEPGSDGRLNAPAAQRNTAPLTALLAHHAPQHGYALELASGTGQHVVAFARALPDMTWQPSEVDAPRRNSINAWIARAALGNIKPALSLDATAPGWSDAHGGYDLVLTINLLHLISESEAKTLVTEAAQALSEGGRFILYGPFLRDGELTSDGDARFHQSLVSADPQIGYKDDFEVIDWLHMAGLTLVDLVEMPANNLSFVAQKT